MVVLTLLAMSSHLFAATPQLPVCGTYHWGKSGDYLSVKLDSLTFGMNVNYPTPSGITEPGDGECVCITGQSVAGDGLRTNENFISISQITVVSPSSCPHLD